MNKSRLIFNVIWLIILLILGIIYYNILNQYNNSTWYSWLYESTWYIWFLGIFGPFLLVLETIHWFILNFFYPRNKQSNLIWVLIVTPVLFVLEFGIFAITIISLGASEFQ